MLPRIGAFEVSTVLDPQAKQGDILFFSKLMSSCWPHVPSLATRVAKSFQEYKEGENPNAIREQFNTNGIVQKQSRRSTAARPGTAAETFVQNARGRQASEMKQAADAMIAVD